MHRIIAATLAASVCATPAQAQTSPPATAQDGLTLEQALELAGANAPGIGAADAGVRAAEAQRRVAGLRPNPSVNVEVENVVGTGAYSGIRGAETTVGMSLPLELGGKRSARIAVADTQTTRARLAVTVARADLRLRVIQTYNAAAAAERRVLVAGDQLRIADEGLRAANVRVRAGRASPLEQQRAEVARINADTALSELPLRKARAFTRALNVPEAQSPIVPLVIGGAEDALAASKALEDDGFLVAAIRPPTVPLGTARLRFTFTAAHKDDDIARLVDAVKRISRP